MKETIRQNSKLIATLLGLAQGIPQGLEIESQSNLAATFQNQMLLIVGFGLFAPPAIAVFNSMSKGGFGSGFMKKVNEYINLYLMMISGCLSLGITGLIILNNAGISDGRLVVCSFFIAGSIGFVAAYFIDGQFGRRAEKNA